MTGEPEGVLRQMFEAAVAAAQPALVVPKHLPEAPKGRLVVVGAGKASAAMARAFELTWKNKACESGWQGEISGLVVTRYGYAEPCEQIEIVEAAHPVPNDAGMQAARRILNLVSDLSENDLVVCLISGGGSALMPLPLEGITLKDKQAVNKTLLKSGATITEMNCVRRHLSQIKGGRLAAACHPAKVLTLLISDVPGDNLADIASGPTVGDRTTCSDALAIVERYGINIPASVRAALESGRGESVKPDDARLANIETRIVAGPQLALQAAGRVAEAAGYPVYVLSDAIEGEAKDVGMVLAAIALQVVRHNQPFEAPSVLLSGGETTVTVKGDGRGGRNVEFLLSLAIALDRAARVYALAADTDGVDGLEEIAGAVIAPDTLERAWALGINPKSALMANDGHGFFKALGDQVITGPTRTNVNDFRAILIERPASSLSLTDPA